MSSDGDRTRNVHGDEHERVLRFASLSTGSLFADRYRIHERCGAGATGEVFRATDELANLEVALKVLFPSADRSRFLRLRRELRILRSLEHPSIVRVHDIGDRGGLLFLVMEFLRGETLKERIEREGPLPEAEARAIFKQIVEALAVAHAAGVVHRDLKPANILLADDPRDGGEFKGRAVLLDFGLARGQPDSTVTRSGAFVGTPTYMSPEQLAGRTVDPRSDLYSLGIMLWEMLSGRPPFHGDSLTELIEAHTRAPLPRFPASLRRRDAWARHVISWLLQKDAANRPTSASEVSDGLAGVGWRQRWRDRRRLRRLRPRSRLTKVSSVLAMTLVSVTALLLWFYPVRISTHPEGGIGVSNAIGQLVAQHAPEVHCRRGVRLPGPLTQPEFLALVSVFNNPTVTEAYPHGLAKVTRWGRRLSPLILTKGEGAQPLPAWWPHYDADYASGGLLLLPWESSGKRIVSLTYNHIHYPSVILLATVDGRVFSTINHPGHVSATPIFVSTPERELLIYSAYNNLAGGRGVVFAVAHPQEGLFSGDVAVPPYTTKKFVTGNVLWYTFTDHRATPKLRRQGDRVVATVGPDSTELSVKDGTPVSVAARDGLTVDEWQRAQAMLLQVMKQAANQLRSGLPEKGAKYLEDFVRNKKTATAQRSVALHQAAVLHGIAGALEPAVALAIEGEAETVEAQGNRRIQIDALARLRDWDRLEKRAGRFDLEPLEIRRDLVVAWLLADRPLRATTIARDFDAPGYEAFAGAAIALHQGDLEAALEAVRDLSRAKSPDLNWFAALVHALRHKPEAARRRLELSREGLGYGQAVPFDLLEMLIDHIEGASPERSQVLHQLKYQREEARSNIVDLYFLGLSELMAGAMFADLPSPEREDLTEVADFFNRIPLAAHFRGLARPIAQISNTPVGVKVLDAEGRQIREWTRIFENSMNAFFEKPVDLSKEPPNGSWSNWMRATRLGANTVGAVYCEPATPRCRVVRYDAMTGREVWNVAVPYFDDLALDSFRQVNGVDRVLGRNYTAKYKIDDLKVGDVDGDRELELLVSITHHNQFPTQITAWSANGMSSPVAAYWSMGVANIDAIRFGSEAKDTLLVHGANNGAERGFLAVVPTLEANRAIARRTPDAPPFYKNMLELVDVPPDGTVLLFPTTVLAEYGDNRSLRGSVASISYDSEATVLTVYARDAFRLPGATGRAPLEFRIDLAGGSARPSSRRRVRAYLPREDSYRELLQNLIRDGLLADEWGILETGTLDGYLRDLESQITMWTPDTGTWTALDIDRLAEALGL